MTTANVPEFRPVYRTLRIPEHVFQRVLTRLMRVA